MRRFMMALVLGMSAAASAVADDAKPPSVHAFFDFPKYSEVKISPDGKYLAIVVPDPQTGEARKGLAIISNDDQHKVTASFHVKDRKQLLQYWWVNDNRILASTAFQSGSFGYDVPSGDGELFAINADGTQQLQLMPTGASAGRKLMGGTPHDSEMTFFFRMLDRDTGDPEHILVYGGTRGLNAGYQQTNQIFSLDIYTGEIHKVATSPVSEGYLIPDNHHQIRVAVGEDENTGDTKALYRSDDGKGDWQDLGSWLKGMDPAGDEVGPMAFMSDDKGLYWYGRTADTTLGLFTLDPVAGKMDTLFSDPALDVNDVIWSFDWSKPYRPIAVETMPGLPQIHIVDPDDLKAQYLAQLYKAFEGQRVEITSNSRDHSMMVVHVRSDTNPGDWYVFDTKTSHVNYLFSDREDIDPKQMAPMQPVEFQARDGLTLHGYLTVPPGSTGKNLPLIINPHGGPHGVRDEWGWDSEVQFFASRGYAVLQVNYRGSGGYGSKFQDLGYLHWGTTMQDDLADAVGWAVKQSIADPQRVCIYGGSYGGYAALQSVIRYPDMYKCSIGYAGVYDLTLFKHHGDTHHYASGRKFLDVVHGNDQEQMKKDSPAYNAEKIKAALFIAYGGEDIRVVPENAEELMAALDKLGKRYEKLYEPHELHGFYMPEHRADLYTRMLAFFDKYIGPGMTKPTAAPAAQAYKAP